MTDPWDDLDWWDSPTGSVGVVRPLIQLIEDTLCDENDPTNHSWCIQADAWTWHPPPEGRNCRTRSVGSAS